MKKKKYLSQRMRRLGNADVTKFTGAVATPPPSFVSDIKRRCRTVSEVMRMCGVSRYVAYHLLEGTPVYREKLAMAMACFYNTTGQLKHVAMCMLQGSAGRPRMQLQTLAKLVYEYREVFRLAKFTKELSLFQPRLAVRQLGELLDNAYNMLYELHTVYPEADYMVFRLAPGLLDEFTQIDKERQDGTLCSNDKRVPEVQEDVEGGAGSSGN